MKPNLAFAGGLALLACFATPPLARAALPSAQPVTEAGALAFQADPAATFRFGGALQERFDANLEHWLLRAPQANPGMVGMFHVRDRHPVPQLVPWAGEFVGKYLLSAVQALRLTDDPRLRQQVSHVVAAFVASQAEDGYLGPFPKDIRLLRNWDLWGHYHAIQALLAWHTHSGDAAALAAARRAGDLVCRTYHDQGRRALEAGDPEMNLAILTGLTLLYRATGESRYLTQAVDVEKDWEQAGDYLRAGLDGREFFQGPRPRWESLHDLQGLVELWRITGADNYREAFVHHWRSLRRWDRRNTGGFSSGEQATGNPFAPTAIETCCTVAWMALTADYLRLTGDPRAADDLELATWNAGLGAQHPSGRWWTYNTPMDGVREASAHTIVFQSRAGTPELNCCSVNAPRVLGVLGEWAALTAPDGIVLNWLGPGSSRVHLPNGRPVQLDVREGANDEQVRVSVDPGAGPVEFTLHVRIPGWAGIATYTTRGSGPVGAGELQPGTYWELRRSWSTGDRLELRLTRPLRVVPGANEARGKVSLYRGPILLAYDARWNRFDPDDVPPLDLARLDEARILPAPVAPASLLPVPWLLVEVPATHGAVVRLVDFANAGSAGTPYRSWLPASPVPPSPAFGHFPADGARLRPGPTEFRWRHRDAREQNTIHDVQISGDPTFGPSSPTVSSRAEPGTHRLVVDTRPFLRNGTAESRTIYWRVKSRIDTVDAWPDTPPARLIVAPDGPAQVVPPEPRLGPTGEIVVHSLRAEAPAQFGDIESARFAARSPEGTSLRNADHRVVYALPAWPDADFTVSVRVRIDELPRGRLGQVFSAWAGMMDDPLRLVVDGGKVYARVEAGGTFSTPGAPVETGRWLHLAAVREGGRLSLYLDGKAVGGTDVPELILTQSRSCALGGNPRFGGDEHLAATFADFSFRARALTRDEIQSPPGP